MTNYQPLGHKRRRLERANIFLDVEALDGEGSEDVTEDENISLQNFIDNSTTNSGGQSDSDESWDGIDEQTRKGSRRIVGNRAQISHPRLAQVIARYEARRIDRQGDEVGQEGGSDDQDEDEDDETHSIVDKQNEEEDHENDFVIDKEVVQVARAVMSIRKDDGIFLWRVRVHEGAEAESYWLMQQRLHVRPLLAKAVLYPSPGTRKYILVEAQWKSAVEELCKHLSTVRHPLDVACIPESEHLEWTNWRHAPHPRVQSPPCWGRLRKAAVLQEHNIAANIRKYAGDLAFVRCARGRQKAEVCVIPRVPFLESTNIPDTDERVRIKTVRRPRLIHPEWIGHRKPDPDNVQSVNTDLFWVPERAYPLQTISPGVCRFVNKRHKDVYRLPFTTVTIPYQALEMADPRPSLKELNAFAEGMTVGAAQLDFPAPSQDFLRWSYEFYLGAPLVLDDKAEIILQTGVVRGVIVDVRIDEVVVREDKAGEEIVVEAKQVRRRYDVGDFVKVLASSSPELTNKEGWVLKIEGDRVALLDTTKLEFQVKTWQLIPCQCHEWAKSRPMHVDDLVMVINPMSQYYHTKGRVCQVGVSTIGIVIEGLRKMIHMPPWFLDVVVSRSGSSSDAPEGNRQKEGPREYDAYSKLKGTRVIVVGPHHEKLLRGRVREHIGNQILRVELEAGSRIVDMHVNYLVSTDPDGVDVRRFHVGPLRPDLQGHRPVFSLEPRQEPLRTPLPSPSMPQGTELWPVNCQVDGAMRSTSQESAPLPPESRNVESSILSVTEPEVVEEMMTYGDLTLPVKWMFKYGLVDKRVWAVVRNSKPDFMEGVGVGKGHFEGKQVLILSGDETGALRVHHQQRTHTIEAKYLFPVNPTSKGQMVVVFRGDRAGDMFKTRQQNEDGTFPVARRGSSGPPVCSIEASRLVKCDPK